MNAPRILGWLGAVVAAACSSALIVGALDNIGTRGKEAAWAADMFLNLGLGAGGGALLAAVGAVWSLRNREPGVTRLPELIVTLFTSGTAAFTISRAVAAERANYWDAIHFSTLVWVGFLSAAAAAVVAREAGKRNDGPVDPFAWIPVAFLVGWVVLWLTTWFGPLGDLLAWFASHWYLATHG